MNIAGTAAASSVETAITSLARTAIHVRHTVPSVPVLPLVQNVNTASMEQNVISRVQVVAETVLAPLTVPNVSQEDMVQIARHFVL